jgi:transcriptional regulator with XRE-family HTH domain
MLLGEKNKLLGQKNNLTIEELANRCKLTKGFISQLERDISSSEY